MKDPLAGMRRAIAERKMKVLRWPADKDCPVEKGQIFKVGSINIEIETVKRKFPPGKPPEYHATFIRHEPDRVYLLRYSKPVHAGSEKDLDLDMTETERARRDGEYTSSALANSPREPESVGPDWKDPQEEARRARLAELRAQILKERRQEEMQTKLGRFLASKDPMESEIYFAQVANIFGGTVTDSEAA